MSRIDIQPEDQAVFDRIKSDGSITHALRRMMTQQWNVCASCGNTIPERRPAFAGYAKNGEPLLVGSCCADKLSKMATPVYWTGTLNLSIADEKTVWRYMDFAKFVAMLKEEGLYFTAAKNFSDPFEGAIGLGYKQEKWDNHYLEFFKEAVKTPPPGHKKPKLSTRKLESEAQRLSKSLKMSSVHIRNALVSCWHENDDESEALWQLYCPGSSTGLAIHSTVGRLWDATTESQEAIVGRVKYLNFQKEYASVQNERIFCKRQSLSHEREVRIVIQNDRQNPIDGLVHHCDLDNLIHEIVVSPFAPTWFLDVLVSTVQAYGFSFDIRPSSISDEPFY